MADSMMTLETFNELLDSDENDSLISALRQLTATDETAEVKKAVNEPQLFWSALPSSPDESPSV